MKRTLLFFAILFITAASHAQMAPKLYFGVGTGLNNPVGLLGIQLNARLAPSVLMNGGVGLGSWGYKATIGMMYEPEHRSGWCPKISYARATGLDSILLKVEVVENGQTLQKEVGIKLKPVDLINFGVQRQWITSGEKRIFIELGYSLKLTATPYELLNKSRQFSDLGKASMNLAAPGGLLFGFGVDFPISK